MTQDIIFFLSVLTKNILFLHYIFKLLGVGGDTLIN